MRMMMMTWSQSCQSRSMIRDRLYSARYLYFITVVSWKGYRYQDSKQVCVSYECGPIIRRVENVVSRCCVYLIFIFIQKYSLLLLLLFLFHIYLRLLAISSYLAVWIFL